MRVRGVPLYEAKADLFKALGHPVRIRILELLCEHERTVSELLQHIAVEQSGMSQHLAVLRRTRVVTVSREGATSRYAVAAPTVSALLAAARELLSQSLHGSQEVADALNDDAFNPKAHHDEAETA